MRRALGALAIVLLIAPAVLHAQTGPVFVVETTKGNFAFETYPNEAPKTVAHVEQLVRDSFYDGQRFHRAIPGFVLQWGDPRSTDPSTEAEWGRGDAASSGHPIGAAEISKKRTHTKGAVAMAHPGDPAKADSQIYVTLADRPDLDGRYTVFGHLIAGFDIPARLQRGDLILRMYVRE
ncbi:MAG TPA: peptidylprolyl isomerase [Vicinamibacterales bacterium]|nr:peptidylprolyl isomerase [Vicinamibacterales bacterium]